MLERIASASRVRGDKGVAHSEAKSARPDQPLICAASASHLVRSDIHAELRFPTFKST